MDQKSSKQFNLYDLLYFLKRNYLYIILLTCLSFVLGCFFTLRTKPVYDSFAEIEIVEDDNSGIAKMPGFEAFSDDKKLEDKIRNIGLRPIAESTINKLAKPVNSLFITSDNKLIYKFEEDRKDTISIILNHQEFIIPLNIDKGCGTLIYDIEEYLQVENKENYVNTKEVAISDKISLGIPNTPFDVSNIVVPEGDFNEGCELPKYRQMYILNTKSYTPVGWRKTFNGLITLFGLWPLSDTDRKFPIDYTFSDGDLRAFVGKLQESLDISHVKETSHLVIKVENLGSKEAANIVSCLIESYVEEEKKYANQRTSDQIAFLKKEILTNSDSLSIIKDKIQQFQQDEDILTIDGNAKVHVEQFLKLKSERVEQELKLNDLINAKEIYKKEIKKIDIPKSYELAIKDTLRFLDIRVEITNNRIQNITKEISEYQEFLDQLPRKTRRFTTLKDKKVEFATTNEFLKEKLKNAELIYSSAQPGITVRVHSQEDYEKKRPKTDYNLLISIFIGLIGSTLLLFLVEYFNNSVKTIEDLEKYGLNILAIIPSIGNSKIRKKQKSNNKSIERTLITREDPKSPISKAYRTLRTSIMYSSASASDSKVIMVSSPGPGEGKTTTVSNLAITYANLGKKTVLIDADLRKPVINKVFDLDKDNGLTKYIIGDCKANDIIQHSQIDNLNIVSSGVNPPNPSELLNSDRMRDLLEELKLKFDIILIDTPPIIAVTDALVLSKIVDNFILVCRSGVTQKGALDRSIKSLKQVGGKFDGAILNAISEGDNYGSGYYYNYYQYYYNEDSDK